MVDSPLDSCALPEVDPVRLSWASGFFDGEGSTFVHHSDDRPGYLRLEVSVPQRGHREIPSVLRRFQSAMLGMGHVSSANHDKVYVWRALNFEEAQAAVALLWPKIGPVKRNQASRAMRMVRAQYDTGAYKARRSRRTQKPHAIHVYPLSASVAEDVFERAWAAGFLDAEGCVGLAAKMPRKRGPVWYRIRASATQHGIVGEPPEVLTRLQRALGGIGRIERHGAPDDYKWLAEGAAAVQQVLTATAPWLGHVKVHQAQSALAAFAGQPRFRGSGARCLRGHLYDAEVFRGGRVRRYCNACGRIMARRRRAAQGTKPRQFKSVARRYTF